MAGLGRKVFTAGDVLTASDVQNYMMDQTVMNFAGTAARSSAIATPTDGMVTYNQTNNSLEAYNGSEWINTSGLQLIKKQTIGSGVTSVNVTGAFSATYENYKIIVTGGAASTGFNMSLKIGAAATGYYASALLIPYTSTVTSVVNDNNAAQFSYAGYGMPNGYSCNVDVLGPFIAKNTGISGSRIPFNTTADQGAYGGFLNNTTSYTDFTISTQSAATMTGGTIYVYGYGV